MNRIILHLFITIQFLLCLCILYSCGAYEKKIYVKEDSNGYKEWLNKRHASFNTKVIDWNHFAKARKEAFSHNFIERNSMDWTELGPSNWGGRTRAFLIDMNDYDKLYAGSVSGGLWISEDAGLSWNRNTAINDVLTVASICQTTNGDIYIGTGEGMYTNYGEGTGGLPGNGVYKSTDGGETFFHLDSTSVMLNDIDTTWAHVNRLAAHPTEANTVYAATERGVWKTIDGGHHWFQPSGLSVSSPAFDVEYAKDGAYVMATMGNYLYRSEDGDSFLQVLNSGLTTSNVGRVEFAIAPSNSKYAYLSMSTLQGKMRGVYRSVDSGNTWSMIGPGGSVIFEPFAYPSSSRGQGDYDHTINVSLDDPEHVFLGGIWLYSWHANNGWNKIATTSLGDPHYYVHADMHWVQPHPVDPNIIYFANDGGIFKSFDGGQTFAQLTHGYATLQMYAIDASDSGEVVGGTQDNGTHHIHYRKPNYTASDKLLGGDGGYSSFSSIKHNVIFGSYQYPSIRRSANGGASFTTFWDKNIAPDHENPDGSFVTPYVFWEDKGGTMTHHYSWMEMPDEPDTLTHNVIYKDTSEVVQDPSMLFYGITKAIWMTRDALKFDRTPIWYKIAETIGDCESIAYSSDGDILWAGTATHSMSGSNGRLYRIKGLRDANYGYTEHAEIRYHTDTISNDTFYYAHGLFDLDSVGIERTLITSPFGGDTWGKVVTAVTVDPNDPAHVVVGLGNYDGQVNHIYESINALDSMPTFTTIKGIGLIGTPVYSVLIDQTDSKIIYAGTEFGVYRTENGNGNGSNTQWEYVGPEKVAVFSMKQKDLSNTFNTIQGPSIFIGTHGRGMWAHNFDPCEDRGLCSNVGQAEVSQLTNNQELYIYPNPVIDQLNISFSSKGNSKAKLSIFNISGKEIFTESIAVSAGVNKYTLDVNQLIEGIHILQLETSKQKWFGRIIKSSK